MLAVGNCGMRACVHACMHACCWARVRACMRVCMRVCRRMQHWFDLWVVQEEPRYRYTEANLTSLREDEGWRTCLAEVPAGGTARRRVEEIRGLRPTSP